MDDLRNKTDKALAAMERRLTKIFAQAEKEIAEAWDAYMVSIADKIDVYEKEYQAAKESGDPDEKRRTGIRLAKAKQEQTLYNARYQAMVKQTAAKIADVNEIALDYINGQMPKVYAMNYNGTTQEIKADVAGASVNVGQYSFDLVDEATVKALIMDDPNLVPQKYLNRMRDMGWNTKSINSQVLQGILQGESIPKIAGRLENVVGMDANAAIRNARTMTTAAENNGRMESIKAAESQGIVYKKTWMATHDARTRDAHADLDGVTVETDDLFPNGLRYPGDPHGPASEIYNCRCSLVRKLIGFRKADGTISEADVKGYEPTYFDDKPKTETPAPTPKQEERETYAERRKERLAARRQASVDFDTAPIADVQKYAETKLKTDIDFKGATEQAKRGLVKAIDRFEKAGGTIGDAKVVFGGTLGNYGYYDPKTNTIHLRTNDNFVEKMIEENARSMFKFGKPRWADPTYEGMAAHELGHAFDRYFGQEISREISRRGLLKEAFSISGYAATEPAIGSPRASEAVAENIAAYLAGGAEKEKIAPEIIKILEEYFGKRK